MSNETTIEQMEKEIEELKVYQAELTRSIKWYANDLLDNNATAAMQALIAKLPAFDQEGEHGREVSHEEKLEIRREIAKSAYGYAHCMSEERKEQS